MSLSDCNYCWETPCTCGHEYTKWRVPRLDDFIQTLQWVRDTRLQSPLGDQPLARRLTDDERKAFKAEYPELRVPYRVNQLTSAQMSFVATLKE